MHYCFIENWKVPTLLAHILDDESVRFGHSVRNYNKGIECGKEVELILAPGPHSYEIESGEYLVDAIIDFFQRNLG